MSKEKKNLKETIEKYPMPEIKFTPKIPDLKKEADKSKIDVRYCLVSPFTYAHIFWDDSNKELIYEIEEPPLTEEEEKIKKKITEAMNAMINFQHIIKNKTEELFKYIDKRFKTIAIELGENLSYESYKKIYYYLCRDFIGFNETDPLLKDYFVEDLECNGLDTPVYIVHRIYRSMKTNLIYRDSDELESFVEKIAQRAGKYISYAHPILDGSLPDGSRVNATYTKDITSKGPTFTIRKFTKIPWTPIKLLSFKTLSPEMLAYLWLLVENEMNILIAGGTSSGKTTLLNAIAFFMPTESRVVSIEDTRELRLPRDNWLPSVSRSATGAGNLGEINLYTLLRASFRQNPDYVIVGEVRGKEASVLFQGMASGHASISTIHADSIDTVMKRLETPPINLSPTLLNVLDAICIQTHAIVNGQETRKLREIVEIVDISNSGVATTNTPFKWNPQEDNFYFKQNSHVFDKICRRSGMTMKELNEEFGKRAKLVHTLFKKGIFDFEKVGKIIIEYGKDSEKILKKYSIK